MLSLLHHYDVRKRNHITMSPQSQYVAGLYRDVNLTKNRCRHNIGFPQGLYKSFSFINSSAQIQLELEILRNSSAIFSGSHRRCSVKILFSKEFVILKGKHLCGGIFFIKVAGLQASNCFKKGVSTQIFSYEYQEIYKSTYFEEHLQTIIFAFLEIVV